MSVGRYVHGSTLVTTEDGLVPIRDVGDETNLWNGAEFSKCKIFKIGDDLPMTRIETKGGDRLLCSPELRVITPHLLKDGRNSVKRNFELTPVSDLKPMMRLALPVHPTTDGELNTVEREEMRYSLHLKAYNNYSIDFKIDYLQHIYHNYGIPRYPVQENKEVIFISNNVEILYNLKMVILSLGFWVNLVRDDRGLRIALSPAIMANLVKLGFKTKPEWNLKDLHKRDRPWPFYPTVSSVEHNATRGDGYAVLEYKWNQCTYNGLLFEHGMD